MNVKVGGDPPTDETPHAGALLPRERVERLQLVGREAPVADDLERPDAGRLALADMNDQPALPRLVVHEQRCVGDLKVDEALPAVNRRQRLPQKLGEYV